MSTETRVGIFVMVGLALFAVGILTLGDIEFKQRYRLNVYFQTAEGLPNKGPVKVAGVEVGKVETITLEKGRAHVVLSLNDDVQVHKDAVASIAVTGLIGTKFLDLSLGSPEAPLMRDGDTIEGATTLTFDDIMKKLQEFTAEDESGNPAKNLKATIANLKQITDSLNAAVGQQQTKMVEIIGNIHDLTAYARNVARDLNEVTSEHKEDMKIALTKIRSVSERMDDILAKLQSGEGTLGKLVTDKQMGEDLKSAVASVKKAANDAEKVLGRVTGVDLYWDYRLRYDSDDEKFRSDAGLKIVPRGGKFYYIGGNNLGSREDRKDDPTADLEKKNTITAIMGKDFGPTTVIAGVIRSAGGLGVKLRPIPQASSWNRRIELEAEAYNFPRDEVIRGHHYDTPVYNAGLRVLAIKPWVWLGAEVEDIADRQNLNTFINVTFKDEDLAYLLGLAGWVH